MLYIKEISETIIGRNGFSIFLANFCLQVPYYYLLVLDQYMYTVLEYLGTDFLSSQRNVLFLRIPSVKLWNEGWIIKSTILIPVSFSS